MSWEYKAVLVVWVIAILCGFVTGNLIEDMNAVFTISNLCV